MADKRPNQDVRQLVGICGLYCGTCPRYLAYQEDNVEQLNEISRETGVPMEDIRCDGCLSDKVFPTCLECRHGFRQCARERNVTWCFDCPDFPCQRLHDFRNVHVVNGIPHHIRVIEDLQYMKDHGVEQWVAEQERMGSCPKCGKKLYWFAHECPTCHTQVRPNPAERRM